MAKNPKKNPQLTKKHQARLTREKQQTRWIIIGTGIVLVLVIGLIAAGLINDHIIQPIRSAASVDGENISVREYQDFTRFVRSTLVDNAIQTYQFMQLFENNPETLTSFVQQLQQIQIQLDQNSAGQDAIEQLIRHRIIQREAARLNITVSDEEVKNEFQTLLGYFPEGTPVPSATSAPLPTSTFTPLQLTAVAPQPTPDTDTAEEVSTTPTEVSQETTPITATATLAPTATFAPTPSPTPYTEEGYQTEYNNVVTKYSDYGIDESMLIYVIRMQILTDKLKQAYLQENEIPTTREEVWARHILTADENTANQVLEKLGAGEDWCNLAIEYSTDTSNNQDCGDLGWFARGVMVEPFENIAFDLPVGEISDPVESGFGWHIIWVLGHEEKQLSDQELQSLQDNSFNQWIDSMVAESSVEIAEFLDDVAPDQPGLPVELIQFIQQYQQSINP